jgi:hypothetical protein
MTMRSSASLMLLALGAGLMAALALPAPARAGVSLNIGLQVTSPPPPPVFVFEDEPEVVLIPQTRVYYVPGPSFDLFRYGRYWYINNGGWWYRAHNYRGPFESVEYDNVPTTILRVPAKYHRHPLGGPPGQTGVYPGLGNAFGRDRGVTPEKKKWESGLRRVKLEKPPVQLEKPPAKAEKPPAKAEKPPAKVEKPPAKAEKPPARPEKPPAKPEKKEWKRNP